MRRLAVVGLGLGIVLLAGLAPSHLPARASDTPSFQDQICWFGGEAARKTRCGWLLVPENRNRSDSRKIRLPVVIFGARSESAGAAPLLFINGGPGYRSMIGNQEEIEVWQRWVERMPPEHDIIILGLRGTGRERPSLTCPTTPDPWVWSGFERRQAQPKTNEEILVEGMTACRDHLLAKGVDLTAYNSRETAADIAALRRALKIESWNLYGISYGTRIALTVMRHHPQGLRAVILDSVFPPEAPPTLDVPRFFEEALNRLFGDCRRSEACRESYPDIDQKFEALRSRLAEEAVDLALPPGGYGPPLIVKLDDHALVKIVHNALYWWDLTAFLPLAIEQASIGDLTFLEMLAADYYFINDPSIVSQAVVLSFLCNEEAPFETDQDRRQAIRAAGRFGHLIETDQMALLCPHWPAGRAEAIESQAVVSEIPTLLLAGSYDPITPPELARQAARGLASSHVLEFRDVGHAVFDSHSCASEAVAAFLARPKERPDPACLEEILPPDFSSRSDRPPLEFYPR